jgi:ABC-2 type transport system ATP-binding protein
MTEHTRSGPQTSTNQTALAMEGLTKHFGETVAVQDLSLQIPAGSFYGLVGPNGAGKTTSLNMAVGLLRPDAGTAYVFGVDVWADPVRAKTLIGVLPDGLALSEQLTGRELLTYMGMLRGLPADALRDRVAQLLRVLDLESAEHTLIGGYSTGMRKKISLATALLHAPRLLVLDEPFEGVDPVSALTIRSLLNQFTTSGGSVVLSSHVMQLVEQICDHVTVINGGRVVASGRLEEVRQPGKSLEQTFIDLVGLRDGDSEGLAWLTS